jgi:hypothetical protein
MQTVRECRFWTDFEPNSELREGGYLYSMLGLGEPLLALWKVHTQ